MFLMKSVHISFNIKAAFSFPQLPADFQAKVKRHLNRPAKDSRGSSLLLDQCPPDVRTIKVSVPTLPPANMVYSVNKSSAGNSANAQSSTTVPNAEETTPDHVSAAIIAKVICFSNILKFGKIISLNDLCAENVRKLCDCDRTTTLFAQHLDIGYCIRT